MGVHDLSLLLVSVRGQRFLNFQVKLLDAGWTPATCNACHCAAATHAHGCIAAACSCLPQVIEMCVWLLLHTAGH
jgi:hypothetical protein